MNKCYCYIVKYSVFSLFLIIPLSSTVYAEDTHIWERIGPEGDVFISELIASPNDPQVLYTRSNLGTYLKTLNRGKSWVNFSVQQGEKNIRFNSFKFKVLNSSTLLASSGSHLYRSKDNALNWYPVAEELDIIQNSLFILNKPPTQSLRVHVRIKDSDDLGIATSDDGGENWTLTNERINTGSKNINSSYPDISSPVTILGRHQNSLYGYHQCFCDFGVPLKFSTPLYKSDDNGLYWQVISPPGKHFAPFSSFDQHPENVLYAIFSTNNISGDRQLMSTKDAGVTWLPLGVPNEDSITFSISKLVEGVQGSDILYAMVKPITRESNQLEKYSMRIAKSIDAGKNWQLIDTSPYLATDINVNPEDPQDILLATKQGVVSSLNGGQEWVLNKLVTNSLGATTLSVSYDDSLVMYLANFKSNNYNELYSDSYFKTVDGGNNWTEFQVLNQETDTCKKFIINPKQSDDVICQTANNWLRSQDGGERWFLVKINNDSTKIDNIFYAHDDSTMFAFSDSKLYKSVNKGGNWNKVDSDIEVKNFLAIHYDNPDILYSHGEYAVYKSINSGINWEKLFNNNREINDRVRMHPSNPDQLVYLGATEFFITKNAGLDWKVLKKPFGRNAPIDQWEFNPHNPDGLIVRTRTGVYSTNDMGVSWNKFHTGIERNIYGSKIQFTTTANEIYAFENTGAFKLTKKQDFMLTSNCLFQWAEENYSDLFRGNIENSEQWGGYVFRWYKDTNIYLGFFHEQEAHLYFANSSNSIVPVGSVEYYKDLSGCN